MLRAAFSLLMLSLMPGCTYFAGNPYVVVTSHPPGAEILVDGNGTGLTTPAKLELGGITGDDHTITLRKEGYDDEVRTVYHYTSLYGTRMVDGATEVAVWLNPSYWTLGDLMLPLGVKWRYVPHELYVVMYGEGQSPVVEPADQ